MHVPDYTTWHLSTFQWPWAKKILASQNQQQGVNMAPADPIMTYHEPSLERLPDDDAALALLEALRRHESTQDMVAFLSKKGLYLCKFVP